MAISSIKSKVSSRKLSRISYGAYFLAGSTATIALTAIDKLTFSNLTRSTLSATLSTENYTGGNVANNNLAGYHLGGANNVATRTNVIDKLSFPYDIKSTLSATLATATMYLGGGASNQGTAGYIFGGNDATTGDLTSIQKLLYSTEARSSLSATLSRTIRRNYAIGDSGNAGYMVGGYANAIPGSSSRIEKLLFSTEAVSTLSDTLSTAAFDLTAAANTGSAGYVFISRATEIDKITFSSDTRSTLSSFSTINNTWSSATSDSGVAAYRGGGYDAAGYLGTLEQFSYSTETMSILSTTLSFSSSNPGAFANSARN